jgi:hypothetical protein
MIPKTHHDKALPLQPLCTANVAALVRVERMLLPVQLDDQAPGHAREIDYVWTDRGLASEAMAAKAIAAKLAPQPVFGVCHFAPERPGASELQGRNRSMRHLTPTRNPAR